MEEARGFVGNNAQCEKITKELNLGKSTLKRVGRNVGAMIWLGAVRGRTTTSHKSQRKIMPICEGALKMSQWPGPSLGKGHQEYPVDSSDAWRVATCRSDAVDQEPIKVVDLSSWYLSIYKKVSIKSLG